MVKNSFAVAQAVPIYIYAKLFVASNVDINPWKKVRCIKQSKIPSKNCNYKIISILNKCCVKNKVFKSMDIRFNLPFVLLRLYLWFKFVLLIDFCFHLQIYSFFRFILFIK